MAYRKITPTEEDVFGILEREGVAVDDLSYISGQWIGGADDGGFEVTLQFTISDQMVDAYDDEEDEDEED